jgi:septal ring factor EnvC (AmiA/AmiB activator)
MALPRRDAAAEAEEGKKREGVQEQVQDFQRNRMAGAEAGTTEDSRYLLPISGSVCHDSRISPREIP